MWNRVPPAMRKAVTVAAIILGIISCIVAAAGMAFDWQWGDVPTWVGAGATVAALAAAGIGAYFAYSQLDALRKQVKLQDDALKLQAAEIAANRAEAERRAVQEFEIRRAEIRHQAEEIDVELGAFTCFLDKGKVLYNVLAMQVLNRSPRPIRNVDCRLDMKPYFLHSYGIAPGERDETKHVKLDRDPRRMWAKVLRRGEGTWFFFPVQSVRGTEDPASTHVLWDIDEHLRISDEGGVKWWKQRACVRIPLWVCSTRVMPWAGC